MFEKEEFNVARRTSKMRTISSPTENFCRVIETV